MDDTPPPSPLSLIEAVRRLAVLGPAPDQPTDPFQMILWENIGYLIDDERRRRLFDRFATEIGLSAAAILKARDEALLSIAQSGGMRPDVRVERWRGIAGIVQADCGGDLAGALRALPLAKARALLKRFPAIGDPGADKILLFSGLASTPSLESNGLRVMARTGLFAEQADYTRSYRAAIAAMTQQGRADRAWLVEAYLRLRDLGKSLCRRGEPLCPACPLADGCPKIRPANL
jgi:endonuclease-3